MSPKARPCTTPISPSLTDTADAQGSREADVSPRATRKATISPGAEAKRKATIEREAQLRGRSVRKPVPGR